MDFFRQYVLLLLIGMILISLVIIFIFFLINKCISRRGKHKIPHLESGALFKADSNKYQERNPDAVNPPLPPRTQFLTAEAQSYENLVEVSDYEECTADYEQSTDQQPDYVKVEEEILLPPPPYEHQGPGLTAGVAGQSYENLAEEPDYEQSLDQQPDYVQVEDEAETFLPHPADPAADNSSTEDYDDIGEDQGEEDYDDVG